MSRSNPDARMSFPKLIKLFPVKTLPLASTVNPLEENTSRLPNEAVHPIRIKWDPIVFYMPSEFDIKWGLPDFVL